MTTHPPRFLKTSLGPDVGLLQVPRWRQFIMSEAATERKGNNLQGFHDFHFGMGKPGPDSGSVENKKLGRIPDPLKMQKPGQIPDLLKMGKTGPDSASIENGQENSSELSSWTIYSFLSRLDSAPTENERARCGCWT